MADKRGKKQAKKQAENQTPRETEKQAEPWALWEPCDGEQGAEALARLAVEYPQYFGDATLLDCSWSPLSFYTDHRLMEIHFVRQPGAERAFVLHAPEHTRWLNGLSDPIHDVNEFESLALTDATVGDYFHFFFYFLRSDDGAFVLIESADEVAATGQPHDNGQAGDRSVPDEEEETLSVDAVRQRARAPLTRGLDDSGQWLIDATVAYQGALFSTSVAVAQNGLVEMIDDDPIGLLDGVAVPEAPVLQLEAWTGDGSRTDGAQGLPDGSGELTNDRQVTESVVAVLLEEAIRQSNSATTSGNLLLRHFNSETQTGQPIEQLTRLLTDSEPIVIIESDIPFVEDFVAGLASPGHPAARYTLRAAAMSGDDLRCEISLDVRCDLYLLSFQTYRGLFDAERTTHNLALSQASVLIGCNRAAEVPEPLRRMTDLVITFPPIDRRLFSRIFERVFQAKPPVGWDAPGADWTRYLVPGDFHTPHHLGLGPDEAVSFLRDRIEARLAQVTPGVGPRLDEIHGLGEARLIAEDLIEDVRAAEAGRIPWSVVDHGMLLIGAPGTGKTTLARAIAKDCGVKFVVASASKWQSAGYLDAHLRAMRADFAEAQRYAPSILFIDEIDSIGSREHLGGSNEQYQTEVINTLLEEIQGIGSVGSVIVIGATNYLDKVDPALRRAGRLDQVVDIPLPNIVSLEQIFRYYLSRHRAEGGSVGAVDTRAAAELAFGLTGADVELFVRGAARRARRQGRPMEQVDLVAEITRRPRRPDSAPQLGPEEMHRVAVHEAGHTVARLISSTQGDDLAFISIVPRLDGTLGFVASVPADTHVLTRRTMLEQLETMLAGRAAEEVVFGASDVGAGAGGSSRNSDLAVATRLATFLICQSGLGPDGGLHWTTEPTASQMEQIGDLLRNGYRDILASLHARRPLLDRVAAVLEERQELSGKELRRLAATSDDDSAAVAR